MQQITLNSEAYRSHGRDDSNSQRLLAENGSGYYPHSNLSIKRQEHVRHAQSGHQCTTAVRAPVKDAPQEERDIAVALAQRIGAGDQEAEAELIRRYSRGVLFLLQHRSGDEQLAHDLHQETFCVVLIRLRDRGLTDPSKLVGFIHRTAVNLFIGDYRKMRRRNTNADTDRVIREADPNHHGLARVLQLERAALVRELIGELGQQRDREILERFYLKEESKQSLCAELGLENLHFDRVLFRARQRLKQLAQSRLSDLKTN